MTILLRRLVLSSRPIGVRLYGSKVDKVEAVVYSSYGAPSQVLKWHSYGLPALTRDTVHVKFLASPINPADVNQIQGAYPIKPPFVALGNEDNFSTDGGDNDKVVKAAVGGNEGVAEVIAVGDAVSGLKKGDRVIMAKTGHGTWRTYAAGPPEDFQVVPNATSVSLIQQATISVNPCTAYRMLKDFIPPQQGDYVIQNGANSAVGQAVIQIAKAWGLKTINVVRNRPDIEELRQELTALGATHVITDDQLGSFETKSLVKSWVGKNRLLLGLNCVGGKSATEMARYLSANGKLVTYGAMARAPLTLPASMLIFKNISFYGFWVSKWAETHSKEERSEMLADLVQLMAAKQLKEPRWTAVEWNEKAVKEAVENGIQGYGKGKQIVLFDKAQ
ncbi:hypothetical protein J3Q64DRAFT_1705665 [Phycomyces blakesleeanus]|uniref:enoyl-[acyl-carrier-protein] reductase n=1 Tax=Phycomyces blakesleeanus TaxID=4837 RepID=A0ABR3BC33_PHYBL